jgi:protein-L-isoaspartate(D-aspartate) O-methyltransferase
MVDRIRSRGVTDPRVLGALLSVPRHRFVRPDRAREAYGPEPLPIGEDQTISSPYVVALMTGLLSLDGDEKVLEIGTGSGYQAAVLSCLVPRVFTIEIRETLATAARERLAALGYDQVRVRCGDGYRGWPEEAPFDAIVVTAAPPSIPATLVDQLAPGGRMVVPVGGTQGNQTLTLLTKDAAGKVSRRTVTAVYFVPMIREK